jgi:hypothetical protein
LISGVTKSKGGARQHPGMNSYDNGRAAARSRANRRLRRMTIGTTLLGLAATGGLGWFAAVTYDGSTATATTASVTLDGTTAAGTTTSPSTSTTTSPSSTSTTIPTVTSVQGGAHVSTGGS